jgi:U3 small nucleolar RNA-associated protein 15
MDYEPVRPSKRPLSYLPQQQKEDALYWRTFKNAVFIKNYETVTSLHFSASSPHRFAVTSGSKVQLYTPRTARVVKTISRFKDTARSGHIRDDGKLLVAGDDGGVVQVFDLASRAILRTIKDHTQFVSFSRTLLPLNKRAGPCIRHFSLRIQGLHLNY